MPPKPLYLHRRRWTLFFSVPFALLLLAAFGYCLFLLIAADDRLVKIIGGGGAFVAFCAGGTFGKTVLDALWDLGPALAVDSAGLDDRRGGTGLVSWHDIESVKLDDASEQQQILVKVVARTSPDHPKRVNKTRRVFFGADYAIALDGLHYHHQQLARSLAEHHRQGHAAHAASHAQQ